MSYVYYPSTPYIDKLRRKMGLETLYKTYVDENNNVKDYAPREVKGEMAILRKAREDTLRPKS